MLPRSKELYQYVLASVIVIGFFFLLFFLIRYAVPDGNKDVTYLVVGNLVGNFGLVVSYFFGSSKGSADKTEMLKKLNPENSTEKSNNEG